MKSKIFFCATVIALSPIAIWAMTRAAASCSFYDVSEAYNQASSGDIITLPEGSATWSSTLVLKKAVIVQGSGRDTTVISGSGRVVEISPAQNLAIRITGIGFGGCSIYIKGNRTNSYCLDGIRIDHCRFDNGGDNIYSEGWVEGLIDHNLFINNNRAIMVVGDNNHSWDRPIQAGTSHALFIEDNVFKMTNAGGPNLNEDIYHQEGARTVIRYNDFDGMEYTAYPFAPFDSHGTQSYYNGNGIRGQPLIEVYDNTFRYHHSYRICYFRGGSILFYNNAFSFATSSVEIVVTEEEGWQTAFFSPLRTVWAAEDQIMNSFFWNNTRNGNAITSIALGTASDSTFIQKDRDYFMHEPQSTGGKAVYTGRVGGAESFSAAGANAYYPYLPFTYPHPLQTVGGTAPGSPTGLKIKT